MPVAPGTPHSTRTEHGFSLIEVIIALTILSIVLSGAAMAVVSSDSAEMNAKTVADSHAMAEKAIERLRGDLTARSGCDNGGWRNTARTAKTKTDAASFAPCLVTYNDMKDAKGRNYSIGLVVRAVDDPSDGLGRNDTDGDVRDSYQVKAKVDFAQDSKAGRSNFKPIEMGGAVDWERGSSDDAIINVVACGIDRPDRALMAGGCATGDASRQPLTVPVTVRRVNEQGGNGTTVYGTATSGGSALNVRPGAYRFSAPQSVTAGGVTFTLLKIDPADVRANGSTNYNVQATYVRKSMTTRVCTQIANKGTNDDGYEVLSANIHYRRANHPGLRSNRLVLNDNRTWNCTGTFSTVHPKFSKGKSGDHILRDPVENSPNSLYRGLYDLEIEQTNRRIPKAVSGLYVVEASLNCSRTQWDKAMGGTKLLSRSKDPVLERDASPDQNRSSWFARAPITAASGTQTICIRFYSRPFQRERCMQPNHKKPGCFYVKTTCSLPKGVKDDDNNCWNGAEVCVANCGNGGKPQGTAGPFNYATHNGWVSGGPNDNTVACRPHSGYVWPGSRHLAWGIGSNVGAGTRNAYDWIGGSGFYYSNYSGRVAAFKGHSWGTAPEAYTYNLPDHPVYNCTKSYFTAGSSTIHNGYPFYTCIEVYVPGRSGIRVRGRILDISGSAPGIYASIGAALALAPDSSKLQNYWNPFGGGDGFPDVTNGGNWPSYRVAKVHGDPICDSGSGPVFEHRDPVITEIWEKIVDDPEIYPLPDRPQTPLGTDRIGV